MTTTQAQAALDLARAKRDAIALVASPVWKWAAAHPREVDSSDRLYLWLHLARIVAHHPALHAPAYVEARKLVAVPIDGEEAFRADWAFALESGAPLRRLVDLDSIPAIVRDPSMRTFIRDPRLAAAYVAAVTKGA